MRLHGIFSAYFGDDEFDVGKAIRRNSQYFDSEHIMDFSDGHRTRAFIIDWAKTFPDATSSYYQERPMFFDPGGAPLWRKTSFAHASDIWHYNDDEWVCFVDCTEGVSIDESLDLLPLDPEDPAAGFTNPNMLQPWLLEEIAAASGDQISLPFYAFIGNSPPWVLHKVIDPVLQATIDTMDDNDIYMSMSKFELNRTNHAVVQECYEDWHRAGWSPRMFKVSALRDPSFDWSIIDVISPTEPADSATLGTAIISYAYARWAHDPAKINREIQRPVSEADDDGWRIRQRMSRVRPITGLPFDDWNSSDLPGKTLDQDVDPEMTEPVVQRFNHAFNHAFTNFSAVVPEPTASWPGGWDPLMVMYPNIVRQNRREGLYFAVEELGPVPWNFYTGQPSLTPLQQWVRATQPVYVQPQPLLWPQVEAMMRASKTIQPNAEIEHPNDTITSIDIPPPPPRPKWNEGKWLEGIW